MLARLKRRLTYANVMSTIAVFGVLAGGGAYAASKIGSDDIKRNAVRSKHVKRSAVHTQEIAGRAVTSAKLARKVRVPVAGASIAANGTVGRSFNRFGGAPTVTHTPGSGFYVLSFPGLEGKVCDLDAIAVVSLNSGSDGLINRGCTAGADPNPSIRTHSPADVATDKPFDIVIFVPGG